MNQQPLQTLTNIELANEMFSLTKRFGELSLWIAEADQKVYTMIAGNNQIQSAISREIELKHQADVERYIVLSDLKKIELEMDRRTENG